MKWASNEEPDLDDLLSDQTALYFLHAWRNFTIVLTTVKVNHCFFLSNSSNSNEEFLYLNCVDFLQTDIFPISKASKAKVLDGILAGLLHQFQTPKMTALNVKLASISSALYLTILKHWIE